MADQELTKIIDEDNAAATQTGHEPDSRSNQRFTQLVDKLKIESDAKVAAEKRAAEAEFNLGFKDAASQYPLAKEHEQEIRDTVQKNGLSVTDATTLVLQRQGKLVTSDDLAKKTAAEGSVGGSTITPPLNPSGKKEPKDMTQEERLAELRDLEERGELTLG